MGVELTQDGGLENISVSLPPELAFFEMDIGVLASFDVTPTGSSPGLALRRRAA